MPQEGRVLPVGAGEHQDAITPIIGTMLVFVIIVMGMAGALVLGVPAIESLQDRAAVDDMATQLGAVRREAERLTAEGAGASVQLAPADGSISLEEGTRMAVAISYNGSAEQQGLSLAWGKGGKKKAQTLPEEKACDFHIQNWEDGDRYLKIVAPDCYVPVRFDPLDAPESNTVATSISTSTSTSVSTSTSPAGCELHGNPNDEIPNCTESSTSTSTSTSTTTVTSYPNGNPNDPEDCQTKTNDDYLCLQAFSVDADGDLVRVDLVITPLNPKGGDPLTDQDDTYNLTLDEALVGDWYFQLSQDPTDSSKDQLLAKAYIFRTDQLRWVRDSGLSTWLEGGAVFATREDTHYLHGAPIIQENITDTSKADAKPTYYIRIIRFTGDYVSISGTGTTEVKLRHSGTHSTTNDGVSLIRFDFAGEGAELWCNALMQRVTPPGFEYTEYDFAPGTSRRCVESNPNGVRSVRYADDLACTPIPSCLKGNKDYFQVVFTEVLYDVVLRP